LIFRLRRGLKPLAPGFLIRSVFQYGYGMTSEDAATVRRAMGDPS
jgi:hypothetical protein